MELTEASLITGLQQRSEAAFQQVFTTWYRPLHAYAFTLLQEEAMAEEMVQSVFVKLWERSDSLNLGGSLAAYLYRAVHNESMNYLKHLKVRQKHQLHVVHRSEHTDHAGRRLQVKELEARIGEALEELPEQCRTVFQLSRFEELRYREIAERLQISVKTVENHMGKALRLLREKLADFLVLLGILIQLNK